MLLLAACLRFYRLETQSFWNDEGNSARLAERSLRLIVEGAAGDIHPPGYYLALAGWRALTGESEFALRSFSALAGVLMVALVYRLGRQYFDRRAGIWAAFFAAIHPALVYYSQEARMYALAAALGAAAFWLAERYLATRAPRYAAGYVLTAAAGLYTHYSFAFVLLAVNLAVLVRPKRDAATETDGSTAGSRRSPQSRQGREEEPRENLAFSAPSRFKPYFVSGAADLKVGVGTPTYPWIGLQLAVGLLFLPWLPTAIHQVTTWPAGREPLPFVQAFFGSVAWVLLGGTTDPTAALVGLLGLAGLFVLASWRRVYRLAPLVWMFVPIGLVVALGLFSEAFAKFLISAVPALCLILGNDVAGRAAPHLTPGMRRSVGPWALFFGGLVALAMWSSLRHLYFDPVYARDNYRAIARYVEANALPGDAVILNAPNQWEVFTYYHRSGAAVYPLPRTRPLDPAGTAAELERITADHDRLFALWWGDAQADPGRFIEDWLNSRAFKALDVWYGSVRLSTYAVSTPSPTIAQPLDAHFGDAIVLDGYTLNSADLSPGDILQLTLFWRTRQPLSTRYKVFLHVTEKPDMPPVAQQDGEPGGGLRLTTTWATGAQIVDNHGVLLPQDMPSGDYQLVLGLYSVLDGTRLPITMDGNSLGDRLLLQSIEVK